MEKTGAGAIKRGEDAIGKWPLWYMARLPAARIVQSQG
jgi:hypothetical protein